MPVETRYGIHYSVYPHVYCLTAAPLETALGTLYGAAGTEATGDLSVDWGIRVWKRSSAGVETEITAGTPVAIVTRTAPGSGIQSNTWVCPETPLDSSDIIVVRIYWRFGGGAWVGGSPFMTYPPPLGASQLDNVTWTIYYWTYRYYIIKTGVTGAEHRWGNADYPERIENFSWTPAPPVVWGGNTHHVQMAKAILGAYLPWSKRFPKLTPRFITNGINQWSLILS